MFDIVQLAVELRVEDAFMSVSGYLDLKLRFFVKTVLRILADASLPGHGSSRPIWHPEKQIEDAQHQEASSQLSTIHR